MEARINPDLLCFICLRTGLGSEEVLDELSRSLVRFATMDVDSLLPPTSTVTVTKGGPVASVSKKSAKLERSPSPPPPPQPFGLAGQTGMSLSGQ